MGLAGAGLFSLGLADFASPGLLGKTSSTSSTAVGSSSSSTTSSSLSSISSLPDYQEFLNWLHSVSGPYAGKSLDISLEAEFGPYATQLIDSDFTAATGIRDNYNIVPYQLQLDDISLMNSTKSDAYDCYSLDVENLGVFPNLPTSPYELQEQYPDLTYPGIDFSDFHQYSWDRIATYPPALNGGPGGNSASTVTVLPFDTPTLILAYRKDVFAKLGLTPPATWDEHFANAQAVQKAGATPFGCTVMANGDVSIIYEYQAHLASFGGDLFAVDGNTITPTINTSEGLEALQDLLRFEPVADVGSASYTWDGVFTSLGHGYSAMALVFDGYSTWFEDYQRSTVVGLMDYAENPAGPEGRFHPYAGSGVGVSRYSKNPEMAWLWAQWATAKGTQEAKMLNKYHNYPTRTSVTEVPEIATALQSPSFVAAALVDQVWKESSLTTLLGFPKWLQAAGILGLSLSAAWLGSYTASEALQNAQTKIEAIGTLTF
jgi:multiple sugar transport system substrate-binding protein